MFLYSDALPMFHVFIILIDMISQKTRYDTVGYTFQSFALFLLYSLQFDNRLPFDRCKLMIWTQNIYFALEVLFKEIYIQLPWEGHHPLSIKTLVVDLEPL